MTARSLCESLGLTCRAGMRGLRNEVTGCYIGDLLSWVMSRAPEGCAWITVMGNVNAVAVASLTGAACIILCETAPLDADAALRADEKDIPVLTSDLPAYEIALRLAGLPDRK